MADEDRAEAPDLIGLILKESWRFSFFQLVRLLVDERGEAVAPGGEGPPSRETVRFRPSLGLGFAVSDVASVERYEIPGEEIPERYRVTINFFGLYGPASPLPNHFTEDLLWNGRDQDPVREFLDLFHHRMISFVWRAWAKYRHYVQYREEGRDAFTRRMLCLVGMGTPGAAEAAGVPAPLLLRGAGLVGGQPRSAAGLRSFLQDQFEAVAVEVRDFLERHVAIPVEQLFRLGSAAARLGEEACLGERLSDRGGAFRVVLGPVSAADARRFLPGREAFERLVRFTRFFVTDPLDFDVMLRVQGAEVPAFRLSADGGMPLGQLTWLTPTGEEEGRVVLSTRSADPLYAPRA